MMMTARRWSQLKKGQGVDTVKDLPENNMCASNIYEDQNYTSPTYLDYQYMRLL